MYQQTTKEILEVIYINIKHKVIRLKEINSKRKKNKLPLPLLKEKFELTSKILSALRELLLGIDFSKSEASELADLLNEIGYLLSIANINYSDDKYQLVIDILDGFLEEPK